jgi:hypothetical protein
LSAARKNGSGIAAAIFFATIGVNVLDSCLAGVRAQTRYDAQNYSMYFNDLNGKPPLTKVGVALQKIFSCGRRNMFRFRNIATLQTARNGFYMSFHRFNHSLTTCGKPPSGIAL